MNQTTDVILEAAQHAAQTALCAALIGRLSEGWLLREDVDGLSEFLVRKVLQEPALGWALATIAGVSMAPELMEKLRGPAVNVAAPPPPLPRRCRMCDWTDADTGTSKQDAEKPRKWIQIDPELCSACADRRADTIQDLISRALGGDSVTWSTRIRGRIVVITIKEQPR